MSSPTEHIHKLAVCMYERRDYLSAFELFTLITQYHPSHLNSLTYLAKMLIKGQGVEKDVDTGLKMLEQPVRAGRRESACVTERERARV